MPSNANAVETFLRLISSNKLTGKIIMTTYAKSIRVASDSAHQTTSCDFCLDPNKHHDLPRKKKKLPWPARHRNILFTNFSTKINHMHWVLMTPSEFSTWPHPNYPWWKYSTSTQKNNLCIKNKHLTQSSILKLNP